MDESFKKRWSDFLGRYGTHYCTFCKGSALDFSNPKLGNFAGVDVIAISCRNCGHIELFDIAEVFRIADDIDREYREKKWR